MFQAYVWCSDCFGAALDRPRSTLIAHFAPAPVKATTISLIRHDLPLMITNLEDIQTEIALL